MKIKLVIAFLVISGIAQAKEKKHIYQKGTLAEMNAVECGYEEKGARGVAGALIGTDSQHMKTKEMLCQEYTLRADQVVYRIRPKEEKHPVLLPVGQPAEFWMGKELMHVRVPEGDGKEREYFVVSMKPREDTPGESKSRDRR